MKSSGSSAETFLASPNDKIWAALILCEDEGVAADAAETLFTTWSKGKPAERLTLTEEDIARDSAHFFDTLEARSLLGDQRILSIRLSNEKLSRHIVAAIEAGEQLPGRYDTRLIVLAGNLKSTSKLRKTAESAAYSMTVQLRADTESDTEALIRHALANDKVTLSESALALFMGGLPNDRRLIRSEVEKLALFGRKLDRTLTEADIREISASGTDSSLTALISSALVGDATRAFGELERLEAAGTSPISLLRALQREAERLLSAHAQGVSDAGSAMRLRPPVWRDLWPSFRTMMRTWSPAMLMRLLARIHDCEADAKVAGPISAAATRQLITDVVRLAANVAPR